MQKMFEIDARSLAMFRVCLGVLSLWAFFGYLANLNEFLDPAGAISPLAVRESMGPGWNWSLFWLANSFPARTLLLSLGLAASVALIVGFKSRPAIVVLWSLVTSINYAASPVMGGGDILLNLLLFWTFFLPVDRLWALDARLSAPPKSLQLASVATAAILIQMGLMYLFSGIAKLNPTWFSGDAIGFALQNEAHIRPLGGMLRNHAWLTGALTHFTLPAELALPLLLFSPWRTAQCRTLALILLFGFHLGIELTMRVALFSLASCVGLTPFIPSSWWSHWPFRTIQQKCDEWFSSQRAEPPGESRQARRLKERDASRTGDHRVIGAISPLNGVVAALLGYVVIYNLLVSLASNETKAEWGSFQRLGELLALKQHWNMFSDPRYLCSEVACVARLANGEYVDLMRNGASVKDPKVRPKASPDFKNVREMILATALSYPENVAFLPGYLEWLSQQWAEKHPEKGHAPLETTLTYYPFEPHPSASQTTSIEHFKLDRRAQGAYVMGRRQGPWTMHHDNGVKGGAGEFRDGAAIGKWSFWDEQGRLTAEGMMENGKQVGEWRFLRHDNED